MTSQGSLLDDVDPDVGIVATNPSPNPNPNPSHAARGNGDCRMVPTLPPSPSKTRSTPIPVYPRTANTSEPFLDASIVLMTSQGSLLDDVDPDVGIVATNPSPNPNPNPSHAARGNGDCRMVPTLPPSPSKTSSTSIPVYPRTANTSEPFLKASIVSMTSQGSLLDDVDPDVGIVTRNPSPNPSPNPIHAAHGDGDCRTLPTVPLSPSMNSSTSISVYPRTANTSDSFLNASIVSMTSQGSLLDDVDPDVGIVSTNSNPNPSHAARGNGDCRMVPTLPPSPATTSSTSIPVYPRTANTSDVCLNEWTVMMTSQGSLLDDVDPDVGIVTTNPSPNPIHAAHGNGDCRTLPTVPLSPSTTSSTSIPVYPKTANTSDTFLNASIVSMTSQGSLLDDVDQDVGIVTTIPSSSPNPIHAAHGNGDCRMVPTVPLSPSTTSSIFISVYPRTSNTNTATTALGARSNHSNMSRHDPACENNYDSQSHSHTDGSYSDDSAVRQACHPIQLPMPEEILPPLPRAARLLAEPSIPVRRSSRRVRVGQNSIRRPPDLVRGIVYRFDNNDNGDNDQPPIRRLRPDEMLVRCESCQRYLQICKSAIVVQCPACGAISPAKSTN
jgi:predicted aconitase with swiveling domain